MPQFASSLRSTTVARDRIASSSGKLETNTADSASEMLFQIRSPMFFCLTSNYTELHITASQHISQHSAAVQAGVTMNPLVLTRTSPTIRVGATEYTDRCS